MEFIRLGIASIALVGTPGLAQQAEPSLMVIAQAQDRCMTTYAVRLSKTMTDDEQIFEQAKAGCAGLDEELNTAIEREIPIEKQSELKTMLAQSSRPNFMAMLAKIRADREARGSK